MPSLATHAERKYDLIVVPGGAKGADTISKDAKVQKLIRQQLDDGRFVGMICAGAHACLQHALSLPHARYSRGTDVGAASAARYVAS